MKKLVLAAVAAVTLVGAGAPAMAQPYGWRHHHWRHPHWGWRHGYRGPHAWCRHHPYRC